MRVQFTGDFAALKKFQRQVQKTPEVLDVVSEQLAEEAVEMARECIDEGVDPYGKPYKPLTMRAGRPLQDSGGLKASWHRRYANRDGFGIGNAKEYAAYHQMGTGLYGPRKRRIRPVRAKALKLPGPTFLRSVKGTPKRKQVPDPGPLPPKWLRRFQVTATEVLTELFNG